MEEIKEHIEEDDENDVDRNTGNWGGQQYVSVEDFFSKQAENHEDDWQPLQGDSQEDLPQFGKPNKKQ
jgi:hypothetical protein